MPSVSESLSRFMHGALPWLLVATFIVSLLPLLKDYILGNSGEDFFTLHASFVLLIATGLVIVSWWILRILMWPIRKSTKSESGMMRPTLLSMFIILILILTLVPWQVAFLVSWSIDLVTCATHLTSPFPPGNASTPPLCTQSPSPRPSRRTNTSVPTQRGTRPAASHVALTPHGAHTGSMDAYTRYGQFRHHDFYSWGRSQHLVSSAAPRPCRFGVLDARCAVPTGQVRYCA